MEKTSFTWRFFSPETDVRAEGGKAAVARVVRTALRRYVGDGDAEAFGRSLSQIGKEVCRLAR